MIALYPGAFKPPHRGHFEVVKSLLDGSYNGTLYSKDDYKEKASSLFNENVNKPKIDKVVVFIGGGERDGLTKEDSIAIWKVYSKYLSNVEIVDGQKNPMFAAKDYAREYPNEQFVAVTGVRGEEDFVDLKRVTTFNNTPNVQGLALASAPGSGVRATDFRKSILSGNLDKVTDFFPKELSREEILGILTNLKDKIVAEIIGSNIDGFITEYFTETTTEESSVVENKPELTNYIASLIEYMLDQGMKILPLPEIKIRQDEENAANFFGRTAYYDPNNKEIVLYTSGRHPKDIVRSFSHEMVHHMQNLNGTLGSVSTSNTNEDDHLMELEKEAYLTGNITFRNWEDSLKNEDKKKVMAEGKYDKISNQLSRYAFDFIKKAEQEGRKNSESSIRVGNPEYDDVDIESTQFELDFNVYVEFTEDEYKVDGGANAGIDNEGDDITPLVNVAFSIPTNPDWQEISMDLKDVVRHELEHLTQDGENVRSGKYIPDDQDLRDLIDKGILDKENYYYLPKEVDAMIQGLYFKAKKAKKPFSDVVDDYLKKTGESLEVREKIRILWNKRLPSLGINQRL
jgi:hypothetical protein